MRSTLLAFACLAVITESFLRAPSTHTHTHTFCTSPQRAAPLYAAFKSDDLVDDSEVLIIGSGLAGLSCAALLAHTGHRVTVLESHDTVGGCAHGWERLGYHFESGPSLYSGLSVSPSPNPLKNIFQIIGEEPDWITYDRWGTALPEGKFAAKIGPEEFDGVLEKYGGPGAKEDWAKIIGRITAPGGLAEAAQSIPALALREDIGAVFSLGKYWRELISTLKYGRELQNSFSTIRDELGITNKFVLNWLDMLCFLLQGLPAEGTLNAVIAYMLADWYRPGVLLDFPKGGSGAIVDALVRGIRKNGGRVIANSHVEEVHVENGVAVGVTVRNQRSKEHVRLGASKAVVSNIDMWASRKLVPTGACEAFDTYMDGMLVGTPKLASFIHLHAGIDAEGLPKVASEDFPTQWAAIKDWNMPGGVESPRNVVLVSMPSLIDPSLAPPGKHVIHAYVPATELYADWEGMDRSSEEYKLKKAEAADFLWAAVEQYVPNARQRSDKRVEQIGTPLSHERFLRRQYGTYGPRIVAGEQTLPGHKTPLKNFLMTGDFTFPGVGVPAAASSGAITANSIMSVRQHLQILEELRAKNV
ncbi:hypothetical protein B484DRAFT_455907 [Ochromonadaceae sp. CCMP2298]|nr:hypothetical protein B484DRAFT_455907 [Ochromonadaceae sp. CCMP2298]|mmetsp:Transcript_18079/g.40091  ORF Transcript_18079/g.40091 Transcript_18079/m.40091 type:complete len:586 (-) Transcript_18079:69-1826(-)|eukprot:CAMPEP_0173328404 /NCGR_PEP_ID=MMETSP1144-20121109/2143_1 /TAXON_ID=483371 /ORGANISM="non described non described, Strain CCMP2298" /LENGTH=585 /DNA_ID=CAMNT_0014272903 /DNA_START=189 /DNA_END=1946 /DNA_ORIENTATION=-